MARCGRGIEALMLPRGCTIQFKHAAVLLLTLATPCWSVAQADGRAQDGVAGSAQTSPLALPDAPSSWKGSPAEELGTAAETIGSDELHFLKYPFQKKAIKYDILFLGATAALISTDEQVLRQGPLSWHDRSITISNASLGATAATAGGIYLTGLIITHDAHAKETGVHTAEATIDSVIMYSAAKAIFSRQRPFSGTGEGNFFAGNWTNGSFPSGHAMLTWTIASTVAHEYHSPWVKLAMYGLAATVSTTRVTSREHFPSDVLVGSVLGYGMGAYVAHKDAARHPLHPESKVKLMQNTILEHVTIQ
jgi:membrane-associated phospholipid phosphatase